ncbi:MAG TPA: RagB/SusD family nutrient uptake outer membrane protein [Longimicrobiales bacterium]
MIARKLLPFVLVAAAACDGLLDVTPPDRVSETEAITDEASARAALVGAYAALTSGSYYGGTLIFFGDLSADNARHTGTLQAYADADRNALRADNSSIEGMWDAIYEGIARANIVIARVPEVPGIRASERDRILGEAHFLRALHYHNLVRLWGAVPLVTAPPASVDEASAVTRAPVDSIYDQILADLDRAAELLGPGSSATAANDGAVEALRSRVLLYREDWAGAAAAAEAVIDLGYDLAEDFSSLFSPDAGATPEDIFRVIFTEDDFNNIGYYYIGGSCGGGRGEVAPTEDLASAFDPADLRRDWTLRRVGSDLCGTKYPTTVGTEDVHVIRFAEVLLNLAEARARLNDLPGAIAAYNRVRVRAGLPEHELGVDVSTQADVLAAIWRERRLELALEGDRWPDLVRTGQAVSVLGIPSEFTLYPIPQNEIDVAPNLRQNPGY